MAALTTRCISVASQLDVERSRREARELAAEAGVGPNDAESFAIAVSELATNLVRYAVRGAVRLRRVERAGRTGLEVVSVDGGPGIPDVERALEDGYSTGGGLGSGLPAVRRLMDEFEIDSSPHGTRITARKWKGKR